jgi:hypothetical protein
VTQHWNPDVLPSQSEPATLDEPQKTGLQTGYLPQSGESAKIERRVFRCAILLFGAILAASLAGWIPLWTSIVGILGLVLTALAYVAAWSLEECPPFL